MQITDIVHFVRTGDDGWTAPPVGESAVGLPPSPPDQPSSPILHGASVPEAGAADMESVPATSSGESVTMSLDRSQGAAAAPWIRGGGGALVAPTAVAGWAVQPVQFIVASERTGFRHLYLVTYTPAHGVSDVRAITSGDWVVLDAAIHVDTARQLVYFMGKRETPLGTSMEPSAFLWGRRAATDWNGAPRMRRAKLRREPPLRCLVRAARTVRRNHPPDRARLLAQRRL